MLERLQECLVSAFQAREELGAPSDATRIGIGQAAQARLLWLEQQLASRIVAVQGLILDLEAGVSASDLGFSGSDDFADTLEAWEIEIRSLQRLIREMKGRCLDAR